MLNTRNPNRLKDEKSPYLLQHAYNPVDWFPWGAEAFRKARDEDKPIFLSVGYSTCYWCHVMEREVFENEEIAQLMNEALVCIKVDREERPDIDRVYMTAVQAMTGSGGWPMSVFITHDLKPFFGATYIPPKPQHGRPGFPDVISRIREVWRDDRTKILESGSRIMEFLQESSATDSSEVVGAKVLDEAFHRLRSSYDSDKGGFGTAPKFPRPSLFNFLLRYYHRSREEAASAMTLMTLRKMASGGIYDQIGGGFHRYSVDGEWRVPHFEKMLYDQAQLVGSYLEAYQVSRDPFFADVAKNVLEYVLKTLTSREGGFFSAEDAESALDANQPDVKEEGEFYLWRTSELKTLLGERDASLVSYYYGLEDSGNALHDPMRIFVGKNIPYIAHTREEVAKYAHLTAEDVPGILDRSRMILLTHREQRPRPHLDDKILTSWNGLMISAFAKAYQLFSDPRYLKAAENAAEFIMTKMYDPGTGTLLRRYRDGDARFEGGLQDYAFLSAGLIDLYEAAFDTRWLEYALSLTEKQIVKFRDSENGGFYDTPGTDPTILVRTKEDYDGAEPTGNSVALMNLLRLSRLTNRPDWRVLAETGVASFGKRLNRMPEVAPQMLTAVAWIHAEPPELIIAGTPHRGDTMRILEEIHSKFLPEKILILADDNGRTYFSQRLPFLENMKPIAGKATLYLCRNYACQLPASDPAEIAGILTGAAVH